MPISFLNPALLFGALASALPIIIHFLSRRRVQKQPFSDLRFLAEVRSRQARSLGVRRWLLLLPDVAGRVWSTVNVVAWPDRVNAPLFAVRVLITPPTAAVGSTQYLRLVFRLW